jgi:hypothetical protein
MVMKGFSRSIEHDMRKLYNTLSEKDKRLYSAIESLLFGHGGDTYIASIFGCNPRTVSRGRNEIMNMPNDSSYNKRIRKPGGGRKCYDEYHPNIDEQFKEILKNHTAGNPMNEDIIWTNLTPQKIADRLFEENNISVSKTITSKLLIKHNYRRRKAQKNNTMKEIENRNEQFQNIARLKSQYLSNNEVIISIDTKKKEYLGNFYRDGRLYTKEFVQTWDHSFNEFASGVVIPHGIYDIVRNKGYINLGTTKDTCEFAYDCLRNWWYKEGQNIYPNATSILTLCDCGGSNNSSAYLFKEYLQKLVNEIGVEIRIAHYPPYTSKYNPIEHKLFPHITRACQGVVLKNIDVIKDLIKRTNTKMGLTVTVDVIDKAYETGQNVADGFKDNMEIIFDEYLPQWNYRAIPL